MECIPGIASYEQLLINANKVADFVSTAILPKTIDIEAKQFFLHSYKAQNLSAKQKTCIMDILRGNMRKLYEDSGWGWKEVEKRKEVFNKMSRFITISTCEDGIDIIAYIIFRFVWDDDDEPEFPVAYCYELQVDRSMQKKGVGLVLIRLLQKIADHCQMRKTSLTCFKSNIAGMKFYKKAGFIVDSESPSMYGEDECYEILSDRNFPGNS